MDPQAPSPENKNNDPTNLDVDPSQQTATPTPIKTEDDMFQSANQNMELDQTSAAPQPLPVKQKHSKKPLVIILLVLVLVGAAVGAWFFMSQDKSEPAVQQTAPAETVEAPTYEPNTVAYAFRAKTTDPVALYTRPAAGGDRTEIQKLTRDSSIPAQDTVGSNVAFADENNIIYASTDHGATYKKVFDGEAGQQITDLIIDADKTGIAFGLNLDGEKNKVMSVGFNGENQKDLFTNNEPGVIMLGWSTSNNRMVYQSIDAWNSDGGTLTPYVYDLETDKRVRILEDVDTDTIASIASSKDTSELIYVTGVVDTNTNSGIGPTLIAPYNVQLLDVETNKSTEVATIGKSGEKNSNGTVKVRSFLTGYATGTNTPYYVADNQLSLVRDNEGLVFYESDSEILKVLYVSDDYVIASGGEYNDYTLTNYDVNAKKSTAILQGDAETTLFGVTTD